MKYKKQMTVDFDCRTISQKKFLVNAFKVMMTALDNQYMTAHVTITSEKAKPIFIPSTEEITGDC